MIDNGTEHGSVPPQPNARMRELDFFLGSWDAPGHYHETPFFPWKEVRKHITAVSEDGGFWVVVRIEELSTLDNPTPISSRYVWGYDTEKDEFVADWYGSNGGRAVQRSAGWRENTLVFEGELPVGGNTLGLRDTFTRTGERSFHHLGEINLGQGWLGADEQHAVRVRN